MAKYYRQHSVNVRAAAGYRCEYCGVSEGAMTRIDPMGSGLFVLDHFYPKATHPQLENELSNLVYSCRFCNNAIGSRQPVGDKPEKRLLLNRDVDYDEHLQLHRDGIIEALTETGRFSLDLADLNDPRKVQLRRLEREKQEERRDIVEALIALYSTIEKKATLLSPSDALAIRNEFSSLSAVLRKSYSELPDAIDLYEAAESELLVFDSLEAERQLTPFIMTYLRSNPDDFIRLDPQVFEQLVGEFFSSWGYHVKLLGRNSRTGADILALRKEIPPGFEIRYMIEVKRERKKIGVEEIHRTLGVLFSEKQVHGWDVAFLFSASGFKNFRKTTPEELRKLGLVLKDDVDIKRYLLDYKPRVDGGLWLPPGWHKDEVG